MLMIILTKHITKQQELLRKKNNTSHSIQNEIIISFEHYHEQIIFALDILSTIIDNHGKNVSFIFDSATNVLLQLITHSNAIHPSLFPLWRHLFSLIAKKLNRLCSNNYNILISHLNILHNKLIRSNMILSTHEAKFQSCSCIASLFNEFINIPILQSFFLGFIEEEKDNNNNNNDNDIDMEPVAYNNTTIISKEINRILISQLLSINNNNNYNNNKVLDVYRKYVTNEYKQCIECKREIIENDASTYISSCYLSLFINDSNVFLNEINKLNENQSQFTLNTLSKIIEGIEIMINKNDNDIILLSLLTGNSLYKLLQFIQQFVNKYFNESATVISHLLCNKISQKETFNTIINWIKMANNNNNNNINLSRLGMESLTSALITSVGISNQLLLNSFSILIKREFIENIISLISNNNLQIALSALKNIKFLILARIDNIINSDVLCKLLLILLNRSKSSKDYIEKIELGPITKLVDKSASVRSLSFEIITDIIEYNNDYIINNNNNNNNVEFINLFISQLIDAISSDDGNLVNSSCQSFQIMIRSGYIVSSHISSQLIKCINCEIEKCKGGDINNRDNRIDSNKKEKLGYLLQLFGIIRKSISKILCIKYINDSWSSISSLMNQIEHNPSFLVRTPSMIYNENMDIGQPLLLSPSLRSHSISSLQRQNSLQYLEQLNTSNNNQSNTNNVIYNHTNNNNTNIDIIDID